MFWNLFDPLWLLFAIPGLLIGIWAQIKLSHAYGKYSKVPVESGMTGAQAAREILDRAGLNNVPIEEIPGHLSDHYDPTKRALFLSSENFRGRTVAAVGVAAHESGHALQHQAAYGLFNFRMAIVPVTQFASQLLPFIMIGGFWFHMFALLKIGVLVYLVLTVFQLVTLPVEFDASRRAKIILQNMGFVQAGPEAVGVNKVLDAAALTYVAAFIAALGNLLYLLSITQRRN